MIEMFAVFDAAAERYIEPFPASTVQVAIRGFEKACGTEGHPFREAPSDYFLFHVGTFNDALGEMEGWVSPRKVAMATSFVGGEAIRGQIVDEERE